jgi:hypothetical protein
VAGLIAEKDVVLAILGASAALAGFVLVFLGVTITPEFRNYLAKKKLKQKYWSEWFAELIIDRVWPELNGG